MIEMYIVTYSKAHELPWHIGTFEGRSEAIAVAREAGAVGPGQSCGRRSTVFSVKGHARSNDYGIWVEEN
jgi:hypothetical protein